MHLTMKEDNFYQSKLRAKVLTACGINRVSLENCREISMKIFIKDKNYLSQTTLQKFFGLIGGTNLGSLFVLDSLSRFTGDKTWEEFKNNFSEKPPQASVTSR